MEIADTDDTNNEPFDPDHEESLGEENRRRNDDELKILQEGIDKLRVELQRERLARKKLEVSIKSNCEELSDLRKDADNGGAAGAGGNFDDLRREMDENLKTTNQKIGEIVKTVQEQLDVLIQEIDDIKNNDEDSKLLRTEMSKALSGFNDLLYWTYGEVVHSDGLEIKDLETDEVLQRKERGDYVLLHPPMSSRGEEIHMQCRIVDESSGESKMAKACLMKGSDEIYVSNFREYVR
jgi:hypothetical protein